MKDNEYAADIKQVENSREDSGTPAFPATPPQRPSLRMEDRMIRHLDETMKMLTAISGDQRYVEMGRELAEMDAAAAAVYAACDAIRPGTSRQCFEGTEEESSVRAFYVESFADKAEGVDAAGGEGEDGAHAAVLVTDLHAAARSRIEVAQGVESQVAGDGSVGA